MTKHVAKVSITNKNFAQQQCGVCKLVAGAVRELARGVQELEGGGQGVFSGQRWPAVESWLLVWVRFCLRKNSGFGLTRSNPGQAVGRPGAKVTRALES